MEETGKGGIRCHRLCTYGSLVPALAGTVVAGSVLLTRCRHFFLLWYVSKAHLKSHRRNSESMQPDVLTSALLQAHCSSAPTVRQPYFSLIAALLRPRLASLNSSSLTLHRPYSVPTSARIHAYFKPPLAAFQPRSSTTAALRMPYFISTPMACFRSSSCPTSAAIQLFGHHP